MHTLYFSIFELTLGRFLRYASCNLRYAILTHRHVIFLTLVLPKKYLANATFGTCLAFQMSVLKNIDYFFANICLGAVHILRHQPKGRVLLSKYDKL